MVSVKYHTFCVLNNVRVEMRDVNFALYITKIFDKFNL